MAVHESAEMYLETILILSKRKGEVRSMDVASYMNYSRPSVSRGMSNLRKDGLIEMDVKGYITLTDKGMKLASGVFERHNELTAFLSSLGIDSDTAERDACRIEHVISEETFEKIKEFNKK